MLLMIDNYDSFTYNLVQYFGELGQKVSVYRNDEISLEEIEKIKPNYIVISPESTTQMFPSVSTVTPLGVLNSPGLYGGRVPPEEPN